MSLSAAKGSGPGASSKEIRQHAPQTRVPRVFADQWTTANDDPVDLDATRSTRLTDNFRLAGSHRRFDECRRDIVIPQPRESLR